MRFRRWTVVLFGILSLSFWLEGTGEAAAANVYIAQSAAGSADGSSCTNARASSYFNSTGNWGSGASQIGPGTTVHVCGTLSAGVGGTILTAAGSGVAGSPVTVRFEPGAVLQSPAFGSSGAINCTGKDYITVDGGADGIIRNTANGQALANQVDSVGVSFTNCNHAVIKNLQILTIYVHVQDTTDPNDNIAGATAAINVSQSDDVLVTGNITTDVCLGIAVGSDTGAMTKVEISFNNLTNCNRCIVGATGHTFTDLSIHDNDLGGGAQLWDPAIGVDEFHHNAIHVFGGGSGGYHVNNLQIYNNYVHGSWGLSSPHTTSAFFMETLGAQTPTYIFNNLFVAYPDVDSFPTNGFIFCKITGNDCVIYNNTFVGVNNGSHWGTAVGCNSPQTLNILNNIIEYMTGVGGGCTFPLVDYNNYFDVDATVQGIGLNLNSITADPKLDGAYRLLPGSPAASRGVNLALLAIPALNSDKSGFLRPLLGAWDMGAFNSGTSSSLVVTTPSLSVVSPSAGTQGQSGLVVTLVGDGTSFLNGTTTADFGAGITVNNVTVSSATTATATLSIGSAASSGSRAVTVATGSQVVSASGAFSVNAATPALTTVSPNSGQLGQSNLSVSLAGQFTHFSNGTTTANFGNGITVNSISVSSATSATANITISGTASVSSRTVTVTTGSEVVSLANAFTVSAGTRSLTLVNPNSGRQGQSLAVAITGQNTHFAAGTTTVSFNSGIFGGGVTVTSLTVSSPTSMIANISIGLNATIASRTVNVTTGSEVVSLANGFAVNAGTPRLMTVNPASGQAGQANLQVSLAGQFTHFSNGTTTVSFGSGITVNSVTVTNANAATATIAIASGASFGVRTVAVTTGAETVSLAGAFSVSAGIPALIRVNGTSGHQGQNMSVRLTGQNTNFAGGITTATFGDGITVISVNVISSTDAIALISIAPDARVGTRDIALTTGSEVVIANNGYTVDTATIEAPTISYTVPQNGGASFVTTDAAPDVSITHALIQSDSPGLAGSAIMGLRTAGVLVTEAGIPAAPPVSFGRVFAEIGGGVDTGVALSNPYAQDAVITFGFNDSTGTSFGSGSLTLRPHEQVSAFLDQAPFNGPTSLQGTFTFTSTVPVGFIGLRGFTNERGDFLITTLPVTKNIVQSGVQLLPHFADGGGWTTQLVLTNPTDAAQAGTVRFFSPGSLSQAPQAITMFVNGVSSSTFSYNIPPRGVAKFVTSGSSAQTRAGSVRITPSGAGTSPDAFEIFSFRNGGVSISEASVASELLGSAFHVYLQASGPSGQVGSIESGLAIANIASGPVTITVDLADLSGVSLGPTQSISLPAGGQLAGFTSQLFPSFPASYRGIAKLTATAPIAVIALRAQYNERGDFLVATTPPSNDADALNMEIAFPHIVSGNGYTTQIIVFGQSGSEAVWVYSKDGTVEPSDALAPLQ